MRLSTCPKIHFDHLTVPMLHCWGSLRRSTLSAARLLQAASIRNESYDTIHVPAIHQTTVRCFNNGQDKSGPMASNQSIHVDRPGFPAPPDIATVELLLKDESEKLRALSKSGVQRNNSKIVEMVDGIVYLYNQWWGMVKQSANRNNGKINEPRNSQVFEIVLEACSRHDPRANQAVAVIEHYDEIFGAHMEFKPDRQHYDQLLLAHMDPTAENAAAAANEVIRLLELWSFTMKPVLETYLLACRCVSKDILRGHNTSIEKVDELCSDLSNLLSKSYPLLEKKMKDGLDDSDMIVVFSGLSESIGALSAISNQSTQANSTNAVSGQAIQYWLEVLSIERLPQLWDEHSLDFNQVIERSTQQILQLYRHGLVNQDSEAASQGLIQKVEKILGKQMKQQNSSNIAMRTQYMSAISGDGLETAIDKEEQQMRSTTQQLLDIPVGKMGPEDWNSAENVVDWWFRHVSDESVQISLDLLERFALETTSNEAAADNLVLFFHKQMLESLMGDWYLVWREKDLRWTPTRLLHTLGNLTRGTPKSRGLHIDQKCISFLMNAMLERNNPQDAAATANEALNLFFDRDLSPHDPQVSVYLVNRVLGVWGKSGRPDAAKCAESVLEKAMDSRIGGELNIVTFNSMLSVYAQAGCGEEAEFLFMTLVEDWLKDSQRPKPDDISFKTTMKAWVRSRDVQARQRFTKLLRHLIESGSLQQLELLPETGMFDELLFLWANSRRADAGEMSFHVLNEMNDLAFQNFGATRASYAVVVDALAKSGNPEAAEQVLVSLCNLYNQNEDESFRPTIAMCEDVMRAWSQSGNPDKVTQAEALLQRIHDMFEQGTLVDGDSKNEILCRVYNLMLSTIVATRAEDRAERADFFLERMKSNSRTGQSRVKQDGWSYAIVIGAYLEKPGGLGRAEELLVEAYSDTSVSLELRTPVRVILALAKANRVRDAEMWLNRVFDACDHGAFGEEPHLTSLVGAVLGAWFRAAKHDKEAGARAEQLLRRLTELRNHGLTKAGPDTKSIGLLPMIWMRAAVNENDVDRAYQAIQFMREKTDKGEIDLKPDVAMYNAVICAYIKLRKPTPEKAEWVLREMLTDHMNDNQRAKPDVECFNNVLKGWTETRGETRLFALRRADAVLGEMNKLFVTQKLDVRPNRTSYHFVMSLCADAAGSISSMKGYIEDMKKHFLQTGEADCVVLSIYYSKAMPKQYARRSRSLPSRGLHGISKSKSSITSGQRMFQTRSQSLGEIRSSELRIL